MGAASTTASPSTATPGETLTRTFDKAIGPGGGGADASLKFTFYAPRDAAPGQPRLDLDTVAAVDETDRARATGDWTLVNPAQPTEAVTSTTATDTIAAKSAASPITGTMANFDAGDPVTFALVVQSSGSGLNRAYDITPKDLLPAGFVVPASGLNLRVTGATLSVTNVGGNSGLFGQGIVVKSPIGTSGTLATSGATSGKNVLIITYDLQAAGSAIPNATIGNTASLTSYSATEGGPDFVASPATATAAATTAPVGLAKAITARSQTSPPARTWRPARSPPTTVTLTLPEGVTLIDTMPAGLAIVAVDSITPSSGQVTSSNGRWATVPASDVTIAAGGTSAISPTPTATSPRSRP